MAEGKTQRLRRKNVGSMFHTGRIFFTTNASDRLQGITEENTTLCKFDRGNTSDNRTFALKQRLTRFTLILPIWSCHFLGRPTLRLVCSLRWRLGLPTKTLQTKDIRTKNRHFLHAKHVPHHWAMLVPRCWINLFKNPLSKLSEHPNTRICPLSVDFFFTHLSLKPQCMPLMWRYVFLQFHHSQCFPLTHLKKIWERTKHDQIFKTQLGYPNRNPIKKSFQNSDI